MTLDIKSLIGEATLFTGCELLRFSKDMLNSEDKVKLSNYTDRVLFFPMDDFITSEAIAISPEFKSERINTINNSEH